jgi:hypothetical protein
LAQADLGEDFVDLLREFVQARVEFVIVGAHALAAHGLPRATGDLDVLVNPSAENAGRVVEALQRFGAPLAAHGVTQSDFETEKNVYQIGLPPNRIDILTSISGVPFDEAAASKITVERADLSLPILGRDALIKNKKAAGRDKDMLDLKALERPTR